MINRDSDSRVSVRRLEPTQHGMSLQSGLTFNGHISIQQMLVRLVGCRDPETCREGEIRRKSAQQADGPVKLRPE